MVVHGLCRLQNEWRRVEIEVSLLPGLSALHFLGLSHRPAKELLPKFKAAFRAQGFEWPRTRQVVVQVRPEGSGQPVGFELALSAAVLRATGQLKTLNHDAIYCGDVTLQGEVLMPPCLPELDDEVMARNLLTGLARVGQGVKALAALESPCPQHDGAFAQLTESPPIPDWSFSEPAAQVLKICALGEHPLLLAGPPGSGKTTFVQMLWPLLADLDRERWLETWRLHRALGEEIRWRPLISPHHSSSELALLGGGQPPEPGEVTRSHGGILFLDEYLEFSPRVQEALREPVERGCIRVARGPRARVFPASFLLVAATNLCPCGRLKPGLRHGCAFDLKKCQSHLRKLSGPMLDRFHLVSLTHKWQGPRQVSGRELAAKLTEVREWRKRQGFMAVASRTDLSSLKSRLTRAGELSLPDEQESERRVLATLRTASTVADLAYSVRIEAEHVARAKDLTVKPYWELSQVFA